MIPQFDERGNLPPGMHEADWDELEKRFGDSARRDQLLAGLREALLVLRAAGCRTAYIDGSFVTAKEEPGDFDGCWEIARVDTTLLDPVLLDLVTRGRLRRRGSAERCFRPSRRAIRAYRRSSISFSTTATGMKRESSRSIWRA